MSELSTSPNAATMPPGMAPAVNSLAGVPSRELLLHALYEAAELEHNLMCTYLYAAFSLKQGTEEGLTEAQAGALARWRREILDVAIEEMGHLVAVWNITAALGGAPRFGRANFPLDPGYLPARVVVKLAPLTDATLQHFIFLERPEGSDEPDGEGFAPERLFVRGAPGARITPMATDYDTVGSFYSTLAGALERFCAAHGEDVAFCGPRTLQMSSTEITLHGAQPVICLKTALAALDAIVRQGEGAPTDSAGSHYARFVAIRRELAQFKAQDPGFKPAHPAVTNPVLRRPPQPEGRVWLEHPQATATVDVANASYGLMLRLLAWSYGVHGPGGEKALAVDLGVGLMRAMTLLAEHAARLPAGESNPQCNAGMSFTALRDAAALPPGEAGRRFFIERLDELATAAEALAHTSPHTRTEQAAKLFRSLARRGSIGFEPRGPVVLPRVTITATAAQLAEAQAAGGLEGAAVVMQAVSMPTPVHAPSADTATAVSGTATSTKIDGVEHVQGRDLTLLFEGKRCIHARFCVTGAPKVFLANTPGDWIFPDAMPTERLVDIAHACPSGAIRYTRKDGQPDESAPPVNLISVREAGPYGVRAPIVLDGEPIGYRATLCRCGASKNKPFCDGSHHDVNFAASGEPPTGINGLPTDMLAVRDGPLHIDPEPNGPLQISGNMELLAGTGRMVCRITSARLCRCGGSATKPFCDGTHVKIGFKSE